MSLSKIVLFGAVIPAAIVCFQNCSGFSGLALNPANLSELSIDRTGFNAANGSSTGVTETCSALKSAMAKAEDATQALQSCIDKATVSSTLDLPPGIAIVSRTIRLDRQLQLKTEGLAEGTFCNSTDAHSCFELRASSDFASGGGQGILFITANNAQVSSIVVNGNRANRLHSGAADACRKGDNGQAYNMNISASGVGVRGVITKNTLCGTAMAVRGNNLKISGNAIVSNGDHRDLFSDGMTVLESANSEFNSNVFIDNTDVDFIFGGCQNCKIQNNRVAHGPAFASSSFAAIMLHAWPGEQGTTGNYVGSDISGNQVDCGERRRCGVGLYLGSELWYTAPFLGGFYHDNTITNALHGFLVYRATGMIRIKDNMVTNSGGAIWTEKQKVEKAYPLNIPYLEHVVIEDTKIAASSYVHVALGQAVPNFWNKDVAWDSLGAGELSNDTGGAASVLVSELFKSILGREADASIKQNSAGRTCSDLGNMVANSPEANSIYEKKSNREFVQYIFVGLLSRPADEGGLMNWVSPLDAATMSRAEVIGQFLKSAEYANRCRTLGFH